MKKKFFSLVFFLISLFSFGIVRASFLPLLGKVIYIDPGHGGKDPGAMYGKLKESDLNLQISLKLEEELEKQGAIVYLTRYGDYDLSSNNAELRKRSDLSRRANVINNSNADLYLSIHLNSDASSIWSGAQVFYVDTNEKNKYIAQLFQEELKNPNKPKLVTLTELIDMWFANNINENVSPATFDFYQYEASFLKKALGDSDITTITIDDVEKVLNALSTNGGVNKTGLSAHTVNSSRKLLNSVYTYAIQHHLATINPTIGIRPKKKLVKVQDSDLCILNEEELANLLNIVKQGDYIYNGIRDKRELVKNDAIEYNIKTAYMIILLGFATGMRIGELRGLSYDNIDLEHNQIKVAHQLFTPRKGEKFPSKDKFEKLVAKANKTKKAADIKAAEKANPFQPVKTIHSKRIIDIDPATAQQISDYLNYQKTYAASHPNFKNEWNIFLTTSAGSPIDISNFRTRYFDKMIKAAKIKKPLTLHKMRHTHASILLKHGIDITVVSRRLGHANPSITYNIYVHVLPDSMAEAAKVWEKVLPATA